MLNFPVQPPTFENELLTAQNIAHYVTNQPGPWFNYISNCRQFWIKAATLVQKYVKSLKAEIDQINSQPQDKAIRSKKLPDPNSFDGNRNQLSTFIYSLRNKLAFNEDRYSTEKAKVGYVFTRLSGRAAKQILPRLEAEFNKITTLEQLIEHLELSFGDPDKRGTAQRFITGLRMRNRPFSEYLADFQQHIDATGYKSESRKALLEAGLFNELKDYLINVDVSDTTYEELIAKCHMIDDQYRAKAAAKAAAGKARSFTIVTYPTAAGTLAGTPSGESTNLSIANVKKRAPLTNEEKQHRMANNLCLY